jgi:hypothetical protein
MQRRAAMPVQYLLTVGRTDDTLEQQAEGLAARVQTASAPAASAGIQSAPAGVQRAAAEVRRAVTPTTVQPSAAVRRAATGTPARPSAMSALPATGGGRPMPPAVRSRIEPHLGASLDTVRVHTGPDVDRAAAALQARAFTHRDQIFLGRRESPDDIGLMAHEAAHVVQQGAAAERVKLLPEWFTDATDAVVEFGEDAVDAVVDFGSDVLRSLPGYDLMSLIAGRDLITGRPVAPDPATISRAVIRLHPLGGLLVHALDEIGILVPAAELIAAQLAAHDLNGARIVDAAATAIRELSADPLRALWNDVVGFATSVAGPLLDLIKETAVRLAERLLPGPAWSLLTKILQYDPLRGVEVKAPMVEIVADFLRLIGRETELEEMRKRGTLQETADWLTTQLATFQELLGQLVGLFAAAWAAIQPENLPNLMSDLRALVDQVVGFLGRVRAFAVTVATTVLSLIKKALLGWLSGFAHEVPGFHLLTVILGRNPFTAEPVPRSAENVIKGFITLLPGGEAQYQQLAESGVVGSAAARIEGAMAELGISWALVRDTFLGVWNSLSIQDLVDPIAAFERIRAQFGVPIAKLFEFVKVVVQEIITLLLTLMNFPTDIVVRIVTNAMQAWADIKRDPVGFLLNVLSAVKKGFIGFFDNILTYLLQGLTGWLFRGLRQAGIEPPKELTLETVLDLVMKVLGITAEKLWEKLAKRIGKDTVAKIRGALDKVEGIWTFVKDVQERGVAAIWEKISSQLANLWDMVLQKVQAWIMEKIVDRVVAKLLSMLDPTGVMAVVNSFIAFFNAVQSAIEYLRDLLLIVYDYVSTIASVARGDVEPGAAKIEHGLASAVPVAIGFLANQVGLGNIGEKIAEILEALRGVVDRAIDWLLDKAMQLGKAVLAKLGLGEESKTGPTVSEKVEFDGEMHTVHNQQGSYVLVTESVPTLLSEHKSKAVKDAYAAYLAAIKQAKSKSPTAEKEAANQHLILIVKAVKAAGGTQKPRASAPGIGEFKPHKNQQDRMRKGEASGIEVWRLESEHVIPRAFVNAAFLAMGHEGVPAGGPDYNNMTTILIYRGASQLKTEGMMGDQTIINEFKDAVRELVVAAHATKAGKLPAARSLMGGAIIRLLNAAAADAAVRVNLGIEMENAMHGEDRGPVGKPEPPLPVPTTVKKAFGEQSKQIRGQLQDRVDVFLQQNNS